MALHRIGHLFQAVIRAIVVTTQLSFATDVPFAALSVIRSFDKEFYRATEVEWQHSEAYEKVSFHLDDRFMNAHYTSDGELLAVIRNITPISFH